MGTRLKLILARDILNKWIYTAAKNVEMRQIRLLLRQRFIQRLPSKRFSRRSIMEIGRYTDDFWLEIGREKGAIMKVASFRYYHPPRAFSSTILSRGIRR
jgi:hypothetical protein